MPDIKCQFCNVMFCKTLSQINRSKTHFCSVECRYNGQKKSVDHKKEVNRKNHKKWVANNKDKRLSYNREYIKKHREELNKKNRENYQKNKDAYLARRKELYQENLEQNRVKNNKRQIEWNKKNPDKRFAQRIRHRNKLDYTLLNRLRQVKKQAEKCGCHIGDMDNIKEFYKYVLSVKSVKCHYCKEACGYEVAEYKKDATVDHKNPLSKKGDHDVNNFAIACRACNSSKCDKNENEFFEYLEKLASLNI